MLLVNSIKKEASKIVNRYREEKEIQEFNVNDIEI